VPSTVLETGCLCDTATIMASLPLSQMAHRFSRRYDKHSEAVSSAGGEDQLLLQGAAK